MFRKLKDWWTRPSWGEYLAEHDECVRLQTSLMREFYRNSQLDRDFTEAKNEIATYAKYEDELQGFIDRIDTQISEALTSIGRFPLKPAGFPDRVDELARIATEISELADENETLRDKNVFAVNQLDAMTAQSDKTTGLLEAEIKTNDELRVIASDLIWAIRSSTWALAKSVETMPAVVAARTILDQPINKD